MPTTESPLLATARQILTDAKTELAFLYHAQAEDVLSVTITSRSGRTRTLPVSRKGSFDLCVTLVARAEKRVRRLHLELLRLTEAEGSDAGLTLHKLVGTR